MFKKEVITKKPQTCVQNNPDSLYQQCIRLISRSIATNITSTMKTINTISSYFQPDHLIQLPRALKTKILYNVTIHGDGYGYCLDLEMIMALLNTQISVLNLTKCKNLNDEWLKKIIEHSPNIKSLAINNLEDKTMVTEFGLQNTICKLKGLQRLILTNVCALTDDCLFEIGKNCPDLEVLDISECVGVTDKSAYALKNLHIKILNISKTLIGDEFIYRMVGSVFNEHCTEMNVSYSRITIDGLKKLCWPQLQNISFKGIRCNADDLEFINSCTKVLRFIQFNC